MPSGLMDWCGCLGRLGRGGRPCVVWLGPGALLALLAATPVAADKTGKPNKAPKNPGQGKPGNSPPGSGQNGGGGLGAVGPTQDCAEQCERNFGVCVGGCGDDPDDTCFNTCESLQEPCEAQCGSDCFQACERV